MSLSNVLFVFKTESRALQELIQYTRSEPTWLAHNGRSFDFKVLQGCAERVNKVIPKNVNMVDTLKLFRQLLPGYKSYSQPKLYTQIFQRNYNAHVAIDDAKALAELCVHANSKDVNKTVDNTVNKTRKLWRSKQLKKQMDLTFKKHKKPSVTSNPIRSLRGVGPKTESVFLALQITTIEQLQNKLNMNGVGWLKQIVPRGARWRVIVSSLVV